jgi:hypothetical protein
MTRLALLLVLVSTQVARAADATSPSAVLPAPPNAAAGEVSFAEPIAPVPAGLPRWAFSSSALFGIASPFYNKVAVLASARRGWGKFGVEGYGGRAFSWAGGAFDLCTKAGSCVSASGQRLGATPGNLDVLAGVSGVWRAAEGKLSVGGLNPLRFSMEVAGGPAVVGYRVVENTERSLFGPGARAGLGLAADLTQSLSLRSDLTWFFYRAEIRGASSLQRELLLGASISWYPGGTR